MEASPKNEVEVLKKFIKVNYESMDDFAKAVGMTRQNLNYLIRRAAGNGNTFKNEFKLKLQMYKINPFGIIKTPKETNTTINTETLQSESFAEIIKAQQEIINAQKALIEDLREQVRQGNTGARQHSA